MPVSPSPASATQGQAHDCLGAGPPLSRGMFSTSWLQMGVQPVDVHAALTLMLILTLARTLTLPETLTLSQTITIS